MWKETFPPLVTFLLSRSPWEKNCKRCSSLEVKFMFCFAYEWPHFRYTSLMDGWLQGCLTMPAVWFPCTLLTKSEIACMRAKSLQSCLTLFDPMDCSPQGFSVHGILQARILEWVVISFSRGSSWPRDGTQASWVSWIAGRFFTAEPLGKSLLCWETKGEDVVALDLLLPLSRLLFWTSWTGPWRGASDNWWFHL